MRNRACLMQISGTVVGGSVIQAPIAPNSVATASLGVISFTNGQLTLGISGEPGPYTLQYSANLYPPNWIIIHSGAIPDVYVETARSGQRFYRMRQP